MEERTDKIEDLDAAETPEDVAALYSWANVHGAKYRDFSASRREYRAQLRHRAAEQVRQQALLAQAEAEAAAEVAEAAARKATDAARVYQTVPSDDNVQQSLRQAEEAARTATAERVEAARCAEAAATAEAAARREEREIAEAQASAQRQAARYVQQPQPSATPQWQTSYAPPAPAHAVESVRSRIESASSRHRTEGHRPDEVSGVREIYPGPEYSAAADRRTAKAGDSPQPPRDRSASNLETPFSHGSDAQPGDGRRSASSVAGPGSSAHGSSDGSQPFPPAQEKSSPGSRVEPTQAERVAVDAQVRIAPSAPPPSHPRESTPIAPFWENARGAVSQTAHFGAGYSPSSGSAPGSAASSFKAYSQAVRPVETSLSTPRAVSPFSQPAAPADASRGRRAQDGPLYPRTGFGEASQLVSGPTTPYAAQQFLSGAPAGSPSPKGSSSGSLPATDPAGPAWFYAPASAQDGQPQFSAPAPMASVAETLQHSRERVAARWFALKGVFEQPGGEGAEAVEAAPVRQKEIRTPILAVLSLAGGVGKTSLVATIGRSLSSLGEKVLLTDTTSHALLPFYFGASELRQGTVRTFSPPSGSTDAPIYLVSYDAGQENGEAERQKMVDEILNSSRGTHRILLDLSVNSAWIIRNLARMCPTVLVPLAPDMNSVISLQAIEKFFQGMVDADGRPLQPYYVINQFDVSLPLHLDVREVLRRQLGDRLLPFVIHRAPEVSEALAEGMTVIDYAPESPVSGDYMNVATWLRTVAAPATAGFRNVRWSER